MSETLHDIYLHGESAIHKHHGNHIGLHCKMLQKHRNIVSLAYTFAKYARLKTCQVWSNYGFVDMEFMAYAHNNF